MTIICDEVQKEVLIDIIAHSDICLFRGCYCDGNCSKCLLTKIKWVDSETEGEE